MTDTGERERPDYNLLATSLSSAVNLLDALIEAGAWLPGGVDAFQVEFCRGVADAAIPDRNGGRPLPHIGGVPQP